ncbi:hypothetical protein [Nocardioides panacihumi]|uniref:hypothetical protein n=1 Tax=Nocardioides panacihumi TaxID=400774 RepID=UPI0031E37750
MGASAGSAPAAQRVQRAGWRDPRLWVGVAIVAASVVVGARVLASADDTVPVWTAVGDLAAGAPLAAGDLEQHRVRFADADVLRDYYSGTASPPRGVLLRGLGAGELLPRAAVGTATQSGTVQVPLAVDPEQVPPSVGAGSVVDVYLLGDAEPALAAASVVDAPDVQDSFVVSGKRQLVLAVPEDDARRFFGLLGAADSPTLTVVRRA